MVPNFLYMRIHDLTFKLRLLAPQQAQKAQRSAARGPIWVALQK